MEWVLEQFWLCRKGRAKQPARLRRPRWPLTGSREVCSCSFDERLIRAQSQRQSNGWAGDGKTAELSGRAAETSMDINGKTLSWLWLEAEEGIAWLAHC